MGSELSNSLNWTKRLHWEYMMQNLGHQDWCSGLVMAVPECHSLADFSWTGSCFTCLTLRLALVGGEFKQHWFKPCRSSMFQGLQSFWKVQIIGLYPDLCDSDPQNPCGHDKNVFFLSSLGDSNDTPRRKMLRWVPQPSWIRDQWQGDPSPNLCAVFMYHLLV